ncbi:MAG TPA: peptide chain release factor 1 [Deltaproteobacteria bacterium]|nr:peptide chain release factor 1 [Deltaproteobacteria bacterium]
MFEKLEEIQDRYKAIEQDMARQETLADMEIYKRLAKEYNELKEIVETYQTWKKKGEEIEKLLEMARHEREEDLRELAREEAERIEQEKKKLEEELRERLLQKHTKQAKSMFLEIRAGTGGEEAALFARDLFAMYMKYAEQKKWKTETISTSLSDLGGIKEVVLAIESKGAYNTLMHESGVHRVQRVPVTEAQGRIHTSTVTVAVFPEPEEVELHINQEDLRIDVFRSSGPGGQHVNTTDSAVRITHLPTGIVVTCQDEKSQHKNKAKAIRVLRARLKEKLEIEKEQEISEERKKQVGTGERSERIRTYNFPQGRVTDHRIGLTLYKLQNILDGDLDDIIMPLQTHFQSEALKRDT